MDVNSFVIGYKKGKQSAGGGGSGGGSGGGGAELNIAYGDTPPEDTTKLWCKTAQPNEVQVANVAVSDACTYEELATKNINKHGEGAGGVIGDKIYLFGGTSNTGTSNKANAGVVSAFNPKSNTFSTIATDTLTTLEPGYATVGKKIYAFGGRSSLSGTSTHNKIVCFDAESNAVSTISATLPSSGKDCKVAATGTHIILFDGNTADKTLLYSLDTTTNVLSQCPFAMPEGYTGSSAVVSDGTNIYVIGPKLGSDSRINKINIDFENQSMTITPIGPYNGTVYTGYTWFINGKILIADVKIIDTESGVVADTGFSFPYSTSYSVFVPYKDSLYIFDSKASSYNVLEAPYVQKVTCPRKKNLSKDTMLVRPSLDNNVFSLIRSDSLNVEIGVEDVYRGNDANEVEKVEALIYKDGAWTTI